MKLHAPSSTMLRRFLVQPIKNQSPTPTFLTIHHLYFLGNIFVFSIIFWLISQPRQAIPFVDSFFLVVSSLTSTGLTTLNLSTVNTAQQILIWILIALGSPTFISVSVVWIRRRAFESKFANVIHGQRGRKAVMPFDRFQKEIQQASDSERPLSFEMQLYPEMIHFAHQNPTDSWIAAPPNTRESSRTIHRPSSPRNGRLLTPPETRTHSPSLKSKASINSLLSKVRVVGNAIVGRNSQFYGLSRDEREQLGCIEYKALKLLSYLIPAYLFFMQVLGSVALSVFISIRQPGIPLGNGVNPWWYGVFHGVSAFNNAGMSLVDLNMVPFQASYYVLLITAFLTLAGNTAYPIFLRLILWTILKVLPNNSYCQEWADIINFILKYPRRVYTHLFPSTPTWWLILILFVLNGIDFVGFEVLNRNNPAIVTLLPTIRGLDGFVQTIFIRSSGFTVISISALRIGLQALYVPMMFISAFPVAITMRSSNVYEERSLGIYASELKSQPSARENGSLTTKNPRTRLYFLRQQISHQLSHDFWFVLICGIGITWIETGSYDHDPVTFSVFNILFEVISAYSCVGISIGLPTEDYSFCGAFHTSSKLILCVLMFRGRHRDLPVAIDRAVQLPSSVGGQEEEEREDVRVRGV